MKKIWKLGFLIAFSAAIIFPTDVCGQNAAADREAAKKEREKQELLKKMEELQKKRQAEEAKVQATPQPAGLEQTIAQQEAYYNNSCVGNADNKNVNRCADIYFSLAAGYYRDARDGFVKAQNDYEIAFTRWQKSGVGNRPAAPRPNYDKALQTFENAVKLYPQSNKAPDGWFQIGNIYLLDGDTKRSRAAFEILTANYPNSARASAAHFRIAEICFSDLRDYKCALDNLNKIKTEHVTGDIQEMAHFRKAEIYYIRGDLDEAAKLFGSYVDKCDRREYPKRELRSEALEYMATAFSDMPTGADAAIDYFKKIGSTRTYEDTIIYKVGEKNYNHGQYEQCVIALRRAIEKFPLFVDAPKAQTYIINSLVIRKKSEDANKEREKLVANFGTGSAWARANANNPIARATADENIKLALSSMAIYNHALAQERKDPKEKAELYAKAIEYYERIIREYPQDKWASYEYSYNVAEAYMSTGQFEKAAEKYDFVATADIKSFPVFRAEIDTLGADAGDVEKARAENTSKTSPVNISQSDAGFNAIVALDTLRKIQIAQGNLTTAQAYALPLTRKYLDYIRGYQARFPQSENAAEVLYSAAGVHFDGENYKEAVSVCQTILSAYGKADTSMFRRATKLTADSYVKDKLYDLGIANYDTLLARTDRTSEDYQTYTDLAAAAIFQKASDMRTSRQIVPAVNEFKRIVAKYPNSQVAPLGWFEAAVTYEEADSALAAAAVFKELPARFPKSDQVQRAFVRSAENYAKANQFADAGATMKEAAEFVKTAEFSIPTYGVAAGYYKSAKNFGLAGDMYYEIYKNYPVDPQTPLALYNAGLAYEEGSSYEKAIEAYNLLGTRYAESEFAPSGYFSIGLCYEKMGDSKRMAEAFVDYARRFTSNRDSQVKALVKAGQAYMEMKDYAKAKENLISATQTFSKFRESDGLVAEDGAKAFFFLGEIYRMEFEEIKLTGKTQKDVEAAAKRKGDSFKLVAETYMSAAGMLVAEWTIRSVYSIGIAAKTYAADFRSQTLIGKEDVKLATQIQILSNLVHPFYEEAIGNFVKAVQLARESGIKANYVKEAELYLSQAWFLKGYAFEEAGNILRNSPIPKGLDEEEEMAYIDALEEYYVNFVQQALPVYAAGINNMVALFVSKNTWTDTIQTHIGLLAAGLSASGFEIGEIAETDIDLDAEVAKARADGRFVEVSASDVARKQAGIDHEQALTAISNVLAGSSMSVGDKLASLASRRANAERAMMDEEAKIAALKTKLGL